MSVVKFIRPGSCKSGDFLSRSDDGVIDTRQASAPKKYIVSYDTLIRIRTPSDGDGVRHIVYVNGIGAVGSTVKVNAGDSIMVKLKEEAHNPIVIIELLGELSTDESIIETLFKDEPKIDNSWFLEELKKL